MNIVLNIVAFMAMLGLLVFVHELGHFLTAVWLGIKVEEFGFGYPPRALVLFERKGVKYTLNWLPIGGFVRFSGENETVYGVGSLAKAAAWKRILVLVAGPLMNLLLAFLIYAAVIYWMGMPDNGALISQVHPGTPAAAAQFQEGDLLIKLDGRELGRDLWQISEIAQENTGRSIEAVVLRDGQEVTLHVTPGPWSYTDPETGEVESRVGFGVGYDPNPKFVPVSLPTAIVTGFTQTIQVLVMFVNGIGNLLAGLVGLAEMPSGGVAGIVGIARGTGEVIDRSGWVGFWSWTALISLNLFLVNLLPIPALDGSHILFSLIELIRRGKRIPPEKEAMVHAIGFVMLMGLMAIITVADIAQWLRGVPVLGG